MASKEWPPHVNCGKSAGCTRMAVVVVRRTLADLQTYNVRMRPPAVSADEVLAWIPWHSAVIFAIGKSLFAKKNCALLCSHSSACVGKANRAFFAM